MSEGKTIRLTAKNQNLSETISLAFIQGCVLNESYLLELATQDIKESILLCFC